MSTTLANAIDALLPQTQCTRCGYSGCRPYAEAVAAGEADINQCPPGGDDGIAAMAALLGRPVIPLNPQNGVIAPAAVAVIDEATCIGCAKCLLACPVDAIIGARKLMHTVFADWCTGCELCIPPCPVDCITLTPSRQALPEASLSRDRYFAHQDRLARDAVARAARLAALETQLNEDAA